MMSITYNGKNYENWPISDLKDSGVPQAVIDAAIVDKEWGLIRAKRFLLLAEADALVNVAEDNGQNVAELRGYRQALRDIPQNYATPGDVVWPEKPVL
ncbi:phage tail assembly chaperone [Vibrio splendidus]